MKKIGWLLGALLILIGALWWAYGNSHWVRVQSDHPGYKISATPALKSYLEEQKFWQTNGVWDESGQVAVTTRALTIRLVEEEQAGDRIVVDGVTLTSMSYQYNKGWVTLTVGLDANTLAKYSRDPSTTLNLALKRGIQHALYRGVESFEVKMKRVGEGAKEGEQIVEVKPKTSDSGWERVIAFLVPKAYAQYTWKCGVPATDYRCNGGDNDNANCDVDDPLDVLMGRVRRILSVCRRILRKSPMCAGRVVRRASATSRAGVVSDEVNRTRIPLFSRLRVRARVCRSRSGRRCRNTFQLFVRG